MQFLRILRLRKSTRECVIIDVKRKPHLRVRLRARGFISGL
jgi:hypothetical protein